MASEQADNEKSPDYQPHRARKVPPIGRMTGSLRTSALSVFHYRVEFAELDAGVLGRELPIGPGSGGVAPLSPGLDVALQRRPVADPVRQVAAKGAQLDFGHV